MIERKQCILKETIMAAPKIEDMQGREIRVQLSKDKKLIDFYAGPEKSRHRSPVVKWFAVHRVFDQANAKKLTAKLNKLVPKFK